MRQQVGEAAVWYRRVRVVTNREAEVSDRFVARPLHHVFARSHGLDDGQREIRKAVGIRFAPAAEECLESARVGLGWQTLAEIRSDFLDAIPALRRANHTPEAGQ